MLYIEYILIPFKINENILHFIKRDISYNFFNLFLIRNSIIYSNILFVDFKFQLFYTNF